MNCQHAQKDMQKALDRRLPQSEQRAFQEHILGCKPCRLEFDRYSKLQTWTRELPVHEPSQDFSRKLFERIQSGEGSPENIDLEPVPISRKLRIFTSGAITAAALMLGAFLIFETLKGAEPDNSIVFEPTRPDPISVSDPVKGAEFALNSALTGYETARGLQSVPQLNQRTLDNIRERGQIIESNIAYLNQLLANGEIQLAINGVPHEQFRQNLERLRAQAGLMRMAPQEWLRLQFTESQQQNAPVVFFFQIGGGIDPSTRTLRRNPIIRGKNH